MNTTFDFSDRSILVTGASRGIGRASVELLCASHANVVAAARNANELARLAEETGCEPLMLDVGDPAAIDEALAELDAFDGLVNCAGITVLERAIDTTAQSFDRVMAVAAFRCRLMGGRRRDEWREEHDVPLHLPWITSASKHRPNLPQLRKQHHIQHFSQIHRTARAAGSLLETDDPLHGAA